MHHFFSPFHAPSLDSVFRPCYQEGLLSAGNVHFITNRDGSFAFMARVDICQNGTYLSLCDAGWDDEDARVFCRNNFYYGDSSESNYITLCQYGSEIYMIPLALLINVECHYFFTSLF